MKVAYIESWKAIELANSIFGFDGWSSQIVDITPDFIEQGRENRFRVGVTAVVKVVLKDGTYHEDVGYGICENQNKGIAIENAKKEAVSDARKRALRIFGNALGNCIYDKKHIAEIKSSIKSSATKNVSYDEIRAELDDLSQPASGSRRRDQPEVKVPIAPFQPPPPPPQQQQQQQPQQQQQQQQYISTTEQESLELRPPGETDEGVHGDEDIHVPEEERAIEEANQLGQPRQVGLPQKVSPPVSQTAAAPSRFQLNRGIKVGSNTNTTTNTTATNPSAQAPYKRVGVISGNAKR
eukprot:TRINITY_DN4293_c1_g2_i3.p1 TRINITY_DN4293_c1_g2~~TRINITY_DN4293_c1_g2_i3.p1  ORF type:complete len:338 (-),score=79.23 TRINITY_DN4293_c1_g2_i3:101-985(-)